MPRPRKYPKELIDSRQHVRSRSEGGDVRPPRVPGASVPPGTVAHNVCEPLAPITLELPKKTLHAVPRSMNVTGPGVKDHVVIIGAQPQALEARGTAVETLRRAPEHG